MELPDGTLVENWTSHDVVLFDAIQEREIHILPESLAPIRLNTSKERISKYINKVDFLEPTYMPDEKPGVYLIVSSPVKIALSKRHDLITPHDVMRDHMGRITACRSFAL